MSRRVFLLMGFVAVMAIIWIMLIVKVVAETVEPKPLPEMLKSRILEENNKLIMVDDSPYTENFWSSDRKTTTSLDMIEQFTDYGYKWCGEYSIGGSIGGSYNSAHQIFQKPGVIPDVC